jgi:hypothetical protein
LQTADTAVDVITVTPENAKGMCSENGGSVHTALISTFVTHAKKSGTPVRRRSL